MPGPSKFAQSLGSASFMVTCELDPPKGFAPSLVDRKIAVLKDKVQAVVVSDNPRARMQMAPIGFCRYLLEQGIEPILTMTCRDRNRLAIQSDLLAASGLGIQNILAVTGDYITWGDHPEGKPVYDLDSVQLIWAISQLNSNKDISGNVVEGPPPSFTIGSSITLSGTPVGPQVLKVSKKEKAGVHFFMSHPVFGLSDVEEFFKEVIEIKTPLLASVCLLTEEQIRGYASGNYPGLLIPESLSNKFKSIPSTEFQPRMIEFTAHFIETIRKDGRFQGVHLMLQGQEEWISELI
jgi:methylenetetrahydrofolate reductase (NADPH)